MCGGDLREPWVVAFEVPLHLVDELLVCDACVKAGSGHLDKALLRHAEEKDEQGEHERAQQYRALVGSLKLQGMADRYLPAGEGFRR